MEYAVFYSKDFGASCRLKREDLSTTLIKELYVHLKDVEAGGPEDVYMMMQGENWSPNGEARELIRSKELSHTSMSIGDIVVAPDGAYLVGIVGFVPLGPTATSTLMNMRNKSI